MKCTMCDGTGQEKVYDKLTNAYIFIKCAYCNGSGKIPQTNEEYIHSLNTEQLADKLTDFSFWLVVTIPTEDRREKVRKRIVEWLKQPHREERHE